MRTYYMVSVLIILLCFTGCTNGGHNAVNLPPSVPPADTLSIKDCSRCMVIAEQTQPSVSIVDVDKEKTVWTWNPYDAPGMDQPDWFSNPDEAKPVYDNKYILSTASGGGVALIRIADKKVMFYAFAGGNPHSAELLPDGNLVTASSTGNYLRLFHVDTLQTPEQVYSKKISIPFGHNVVWDNRRNVLWTAGKNILYSYKYDGNCANPGLSAVDSVQLPGSDAHDLFPAYRGDNTLWFTNPSGTYTYDLSEEKIRPANTSYQKDIKSVSSGPEGYPTIIIYPKEQWWTNEVIDLQGNSVFIQPGYKIYKARWFVENHFSYPADHPFKMCKE